MRSTNTFSGVEDPCRRVISCRGLAGTKQQRRSIGSLFLSTRVWWTPGPPPTRNMDCVSNYCRQGTIQLLLTIFNASRKWNTRSALQAQAYVDVLLFFPPPPCCGSSQLKNATQEDSVTHRTRGPHCCYQLFIACMPPAVRDLMGEEMALMNEWPLAHLIATLRKKECRMGMQQLTS